ncbi:MAG: hypothetical protein EZS28_014539 [Streblomastix strix]|uniref:Uncharacterized protein n=1 Tax=Streblomastix strix TaxID=222440 RepID=A0A5J4W4Z6_9EUKA|nr:MAG: hypothetical protein EZS28_014539 [Streblomastix strix]
MDTGNSSKQSFQQLGVRVVQKVLFPGNVSFFFGDLNHFETLILAADEVGYQLFADSRTKVIIVKASDKFKKLYFPVDRSETRLSIMAGAAFSNDVLLPYIIVKHLLNIDKFKVARVRDGIDAVLLSYLMWKKRENA